MVANYVKSGCWLGDGKDLNCTLVTHIFALLQKAVWKNCVWYKVFTKQKCHSIHICGKNCRYWYSMSLAECSGLNFLVNVSHILLISMREPLIGLFEHSMFTDSFSLLSYNPILKLYLTEIGELPYFSTYNQTCLTLKSLICLPTLFRTLFYRSLGLECTVQTKRRN